MFSGIDGASLPDRRGGELDAVDGDPSVGSARHAYDHVAELQLELRDGLARRLLVGLRRIDERLREERAQRLDRDDVATELLVRDAEAVERDGRALDLQGLLVTDDRLGPLALLGELRAGLEMLTRDRDVGWVGLVGSSRGARRSAQPTRTRT
jgi:hypothetical protein